MTTAALYRTDPAAWCVLCDFDGTVTPFDVTDALLTSFAPQQWEDIEQRWIDGKLTARQCMERQIALLEVSIPRLNNFLDDIPLTPGFREFAESCLARSLDFRIVSDGLDYAIERILTRHGLTGIPIVANRLHEHAPSRYELAFPHGRPHCPSGVCKCAVATAAEKNILLIGDGLSDCCVASKATFIMAKTGKTLHKKCALHGMPHREFVDFHDVRSLVFRTVRYRQAVCPPLLLSKDSVKDDYRRTGAVAR